MKWCLNEQVEIGGLPAWLEPGVVYEGEWAPAPIRDPRHVLLRSSDQDVSIEFSYRRLTRVWEDERGQPWGVTLSSSPQAMAIGNVIPPAPAGPQEYLRFRRLRDPRVRRSVLFTSDKPVSGLTDEEIADYWEQVVADHPELA